MDNKFNELFNFYTEAEEKHSQLKKEFIESAENIYKIRKETAKFALKNNLLRPMTESDIVIDKIVFGVPDCYRDDYNNDEFTMMKVDKIIKVERYNMIHFMCNSGRHSISEMYVLKE